LNGEIIQLLIKYVNNHCNRDELDKVNAILQQGGYEQEWKTVIDQHARETMACNIVILEDQMPDTAKLLDRIKLTTKIKDKATRQITWWKWLGSAAASLVLVSLIVLFYTKYHYGDRNMVIKVKQQNHDIAPGSNKAVLTLANGSLIVLDSAENGELARQAGIKVYKTKNGELVYQGTPDGQNIGVPDANNTISTPKGGQYKVSLPDGTKVWLNAASSLSYPAVFTGKERRVELSGEAYFEVAHNKSMPFKVKTANQVVEVLGTHFNINAYNDESLTNTTLIEGSVKVTSGINKKVIIKPGQQSTLKGNTLNIRMVDTDEFIAWRNGYFQFSEEDLSSIMRKISRWYNVEVEYKDEKLQNNHYSGTVSRYENVSQIIKVLELSNAAHFKIEGNKIIVAH
jgi:transmembrane sensor